MTEVFIVESESGNGSYRVQLGDAGEVHCNCKSFEFSAWPKTCKHIRKLQAERHPSMNDPRVSDPEYCEECKGVTEHMIGCPNMDKAR